MKSSLITSAIIFVAGTVVAFIAGDMLMPKIEDFSIKTINIENSATLSEPNIEIFNYRAINPTVEVYVGGDEESSDNDLNPSVPDENNNENNDDNISPDNPPEENDNGTTD